MWFARLAALATLALAVVAATFAVEAQPAKVARVGRLNGEGVFTPNGPLTAELLRGLREQGYTEGQNLTIEYRSAEGRNEAFPALVAELVRLKVDVIIAHGGPATLAAKRATTTIPIVLVNVGDPVRLGLVASLARPGGNVTGVSSQALDFAAKLLELARRAVPRLDRVAVITTPTNPYLAPQVRNLQAGASALGIALDSF